MKASAGKKQLKVLFLSQRFLFPMDTGGKIRTGKLLEKLNGIFDITLISNVESPKDDPYLKDVERLCAEFHPVPWTEVKKYTFWFYVRLLWRTFSRYPVSALNDYSKGLETKIHSVLAKDQYDLVICDFAQSGLNFRKVHGYPSLLFQHNVESMIPYRHYRTARDPLSKFFWWLQWVKMSRYERRVCHQFSGTVAVSEGDKKILEEQFSVPNAHAIPTGVDTDFYSPREEPVHDNSIVFVGAMDWLPNEDAILFFLEEIYGKIKKQIPTLKFTVVGRNPSPRLTRELQKYPEITVTGWVDDVRPFVARHTLSIIPMRVGGGTRIKVYEAMAMGKVVVSTHVGTEGLPVTSGENVVLEDSAEEFANAVVRLLRDTETRERIEKAARVFVETHASWTTVAEHFSGICRQIFDSHKKAEERRPS